MLHREKEEIFLLEVGKLGKSPLVIISRSKNEMMEQGMEHLKKERKDFKVEEDGEAVYFDGDRDFISRQRIRQRRITYASQTWLIGKQGQFLGTTMGLGVVRRDLTSASPLAFFLSLVRESAWVHDNFLDREI